MREPLPTFSDDPFLDLAVREAVMFRGLANEKKQAKKKARDEWKARGYRGDEA